METIKAIGDTLTLIDQQIRQMHFWLIGKIGPERDQLGVQLDQLKYQRDLLDAKQRRLVKAYFDPASPDSHRYAELTTSIKNCNAAMQGTIATIDKIKNTLETVTSTLGYVDELINLVASVI